MAVQLLHCPHMLLVLTTYKRTERRVTKVQEWRHALAEVEYAREERESEEALLHEEVTRWLEPNGHGT